jgi:hypothetical protein
MSEYKPIVRLPEEVPALFWLEHLATLRRNWKLVVSVVLASAAAAFLVSSLETPVYHAHATIEVEGITDNLLKAQDGNPNSGADPEVMDIPNSDSHHAKRDAARSRPSPHGK